MTKQTFSLVPFPAANLPDITVRGNISRQDDSITLHYEVCGNIETIQFPKASIAASRKDELWTATCFEFFVATKDQPQYWEFNMSPSGDWNVFVMDAYRRVGFRAETKISRLPFDFKKHSHEYSLDVLANLNPIIPADRNIQIGIAAIVQSTDGQETYWALAHPAQHADFHLREGFTITL